MSLTLLEQPVAALPCAPGPYRRADYMVLPDDLRCELIHGRFYLSPSPLPVHQVVAACVWRLQDDIALATGGLACSAPLDVHLADDTVAQPDVLYISAERRGILRPLVEGAPDLVVEVLSASTAGMDRVLKLHRYAEAGVLEYWIVDPVARRFEFLVHDGRRFGVHEPVEGTWESPSVPGVRLEIDAFWAGVDRRLDPAQAAE